VADEVVWEGEGDNLWLMRYRTIPVLRVLREKGMG
jgi:hypothetical protein